MNPKGSLFEGAVRGSGIPWESDGRSVYRQNATPSVIFDDTSLGEGGLG